MRSVYNAGANDDDYFCFSGAQSRIGLEERDRELQKKIDNSWAAIASQVCVCVPLN